MNSSDVTGAESPAECLSRLLASGGDERIALGPPGGVNRYGCPPRPLPQVPAFGSSTASAISDAGWAAARILHRRLEGAGQGPGADAALAAEADRQRSELAALCGVSTLANTGVVFAASGTDLHLLAAQLCAAETRAHPGPASLQAVIVEAAETGCGVPDALAGRHPGSRPPLAGPVHPGDPVAGAFAVDVTSVPLRFPAGGAPQNGDHDARVAELVNAAVNAGRRVLLVVSDQSKTGRLAPRPVCALALLRRHGGRVRVLVDACQFRLSAATLRSYLDHGFAVALSGSKFVTGPAFSGALLVPPGLSQAWRTRPLPPGLAAYSARADWPVGWAGRDSLPEAANVGLLLRWEAALA